MSRPSYSTDLSDQEWAILEPLVPVPKTGGRPAKHSRREIVNLILYVLPCGGAWRRLPHDLPPWFVAYQYFWRWRRDGTWQRIHDALRQQSRQAIGRETTPSAAVIDSSR